MNEFEQFFSMGGLNYKLSDESNFGFCLWNKTYFAWGSNWTFLQNGSSYKLFTTQYTDLFKIYKSVRTIIWCKYSYLVKYSENNSIILCNELVVNHLNQQQHRPILCTINKCQVQYIYIQNN
jgi:hypothetical protein